MIAYLGASISKSSKVLVALMLSGAALVAACGGGGAKSGSSGTAAPTGSPIKLGVMADMNGTSAPVGASIRLATALAVQQINAAGGINGHPLQATYVDPQSDPQQAIQMATQLVQQDHVDVLVGAVLSSECLGVEQRVAQLQTVYVTSGGCAAEDVTAKGCNHYTFRMDPVGRQVIGPLADYMVRSYGKRWAVIYNDYAYGQSQLAAYKAVLQSSGGSVTVEIAMPQNEPNVAPYITKVPTDGSVDGIVVAGLGAGDQARVVGGLAQFGISKKLPIVGAGTKEGYSGVYPDALNGSIGQSQFLSNQPDGNKLAAAFETDFRNMGAKDTESLNIIGGQKAVPGSIGYIAYTAITSLKEGMIASKFSGRADTEKLIAALENLKAPLGPDFPGGDFVIDKTDHQGAMTTYIYKIDGQNEPVLTTIPADKIPPIGSCKI
jgi:branched-chain amino acid transport system substrate-binding protein